MMRVDCSFRQDDTSEGLRPLIAEEAVSSTSSSLFSIVGRKGFKVVRSPTSLSELLTSDHFVTAEEWGRPPFVAITFFLGSHVLSLYMPPSDEIDRNTIHQYSLLSYAA
jgi:hypothetical protein